MSSDLWNPLLTEPDSRADETSLIPWFQTLAHRLLQGAGLVVGKTSFRFTEVEIYYHGPGHLDPFTHRDPLQKTSGRWYFHRTAGRLRSGSFKGLDLTFGRPEAFGGVLIRGLQPEGQAPIDGPSLCVDRLIELTQSAGVVALDRAVTGRSAWDEDSPVRLAWLSEPLAGVPLRTARVGLSLKRFTPGDEAVRFLLRRYRSLADPRQTAKGKLHMALALHADGLDPDTIRLRTGCTSAALNRYLADYALGRAQNDFGPYYGVDLGPKELAALHGLAHVRFGHT